VSNILQRLLLFFLGLPLVAGIIILLPGFHHGAAVLLILVFLGGCALELSRFFRSRGIEAKPFNFIVLGAGIPACAYAGRLLGGLMAGDLGLTWALAGVVLGSGLAFIAFFASFAFVRQEAIPEVLPRANALAFVAVYPGILGSFVVLIASEPRYAMESLLSFCILAFSNDSLAWLVGMTLGRRRGIVAVSPNKSLAGFIGGMGGSIGMAFGCAALFPRAVSGPWWSLLALGLVVGAAVIIGDLFESALKRSASIKDSGSTVPGRGGFLDSFDSLLFAAPVFYGLSLLMGFFR
jgi:phosphatidate cytidylyltransferase